MKLKFITLNIEHGGQLMDKVVQFLHEQNPDILFLQEAQDNLSHSITLHFNTISHLALTLPLEHHLFYPHYDVILDGIKVRHGNAIFSRFPLQFTKQVFFDVPYQTIDHVKNKENDDYSQIPQSMLCATTTIDDHVINLYNVHGIWGKDGHDSTRRFQMAKTILENVETGRTLIMAGDFNMQPNTGAIRLIADRLASVFGTTLTSTFNMRRKSNPGYATAAVDMIFLSQDLRVLNATCPQVEISDHLPLVCELEL